MSQILHQPSSDTSSPGFLPVAPTIAQVPQPFWAAYGLVMLAVLAIGLDSSLGFFSFARVLVVFFLCRWPLREGGFWYSPAWLLWHLVFHHLLHYFSLVSLVRGCLEMGSREP